jgi:hypothetical protein
MLVALDQELTQDTELHCMGGFVLAQHYGLVRPTDGSRRSMRYINGVTGVDTATGET